MSKLALNGVHVFKKVHGTQQFALSEIHPILRLGNGDAVLLIQHGRVFTAGGDLVAAKDIPAWFADAVAKANPAVLAECGYKVPAQSEPTALSKSRAKRLAVQKPEEAAPTA